MLTIKLRGHYQEMDVTVHSAKRAITQAQVQLLDILKKPLIGSEFNFQISTKVNQCIISERYFREICEDGTQIYPNDAKEPFKLQRRNGKEHEILGYTILPVGYGIYPMKFYVIRSLKGNAYMPAYHHQLLVEDCDELVTNQNDDENCKIAAIKKSKTLIIVPN